MKSFLAVLFLILFTASVAIAQEHEVYIDEPEFVNCNVLRVPVKVKNFENVGAISLKLEYEKDRLQFKEVSLNSEFLKAETNGGNGQFVFGFFGENISLPDNEVLFELQFQMLSAGPVTTNLEWLDLPNTGNCELAGLGGVPVYTTNFVDGDIIQIPGELKAEAEFDSLICENGNTSVVITASGGTTPYSGTGAFTVPAGSHVFNVTDANGCTDEITVNIPSPDSSTLTINSIEILSSTPVEFGSNMLLKINFIADLESNITVNWGDGTSSFFQNPADGDFITSHIYSEPGVFTIEVFISDICGNIVSEKYEYAVVIKRGAGFVTGGGWIESPSGAYLLDSSITGKAHFGFVCRYQKGELIPKGNMEFQFQAADLNFSSRDFEWLIIYDEIKAEFKGLGKINGKGSYQFLVSIIDGGHHQKDSFRIMIWDKMENDTKIYDNKIENEFSNGSITIHTNNNNKSKELVTGKNLIPVNNQAEFLIYPNPLKNRLRLQFIPSVSSNASLELYNVKGQLIQVLFNENVNENELFNKEFLIDFDGVQTLFYRFKIDQEVYTGQFQMIQ